MYKYECTKMPSNKYCFDDKKRILKIFHIQKNKMYRSFSQFLYIVVQNCVQKIMEDKVDEFLDISVQNIRCFER